MTYDDGLEELGMIGIVVLALLVGMTIGFVLARFVV
jgi:hypothetical protein